MSNDNYNKPQQQHQQQQPPNYSISRYQMYYKLLLDTLLRFFYFILIVSIILAFMLIFFTNQLQNSHVDYTERLLNERAEQDIDYYFMDIERQMMFISKTIAKVLELQHQSYQLQGKLYYKQRSELMNVEKMMYMNKYNTTGEYACLGNCTALQPYLINLWDKRVQLSSISVIYIHYNDPISNSTNIIYTPADKNHLTIQQITTLLSNKTTKSSSLIKINNQLFMKQTFSYMTQFDPDFQITMAIMCSKQQMVRILTSDVELYSHYDYKVWDDVKWVDVSGVQTLSAFAYREGEVTKAISYVDYNSNLTLITFYCQTTQIVSYFTFVKLTLLLPILIFTLLFSTIKTIICKALYKFFKNTQTLVTLYQYNIQQIFTGKHPKLTIILNETTTTDFYQQLSQLPTNQYQPVVHQEKKKVLSKSFIFIDTLKVIVEKYNDYAKSIFQQKNKQIINNKFFIYASVNDLSQAESQKIKQGYNKARELRMLKRFFKYAYLSLLLDSDQFDNLITHDSSPLPTQLITMMRELNRTVSSASVRRAFSLSPDVRIETQQQLEMRIQVNLMQKYLQMLKQMDVHNYFAKELKLYNELENINQFIQNIKHVLNKHNKNIRTMGR